MKDLIPKRIRIIIWTIGLGLLAWAFYFEPSSFRIQTYHMHIPALKLPREYRIGVIADLHAGSPYHSLKKIKRVVREVNEAQLDLVLIAGDVVIQDVRGGEFVPPEETAMELGKIKAKDGVFGVLGNHDWWLDPVRVTKAFEDSGIPMLDEKFVTIAGKFYLMGIGDLWEGNPDPVKNLSSIPDDLPIIALTHNPDIFPDIPERVALTVAGHTHGGQVYFPLVGRLVVPSKYGERYAIGAVYENNHYLFVSSGIGTSLMPVRFLVPPEVSVIEIR